MTQRGAYRRSVFDLHRHENITDPASPATVAIRNQSRWGLQNTLATPFTSGTLFVLKFTLEAGDVVTSLNLAIAGTALGTPTNQWAALYTPDSGGAGGLAAKTLFVAQGADQLTAVGAVNTTKTLPLSGVSAPITIPYSGDWYVAFNLAGATMPVVYSNLVAPAIATGEGGAAWTTSNTGLTGTAPATLGTMTVSNQVPYAELT